MNAPHNQQRCWIIGFVGLLLLVRGEVWAEELRISLDGKKIPVRCLSLNGTPRALSPGDLIEVDDIWIRLDGDEPLSLRSERRKWGRIFFSEPADHPVAVRISRKCAVDPLGEFSDEELLGLRGLYLSYWPAGIEASIELLDARKCAFTLFSLAAVGRENAVPELPAELECLVLRTGCTNGFTDFENLRRLTRLRVFAADPVMLDPPCSVVATLGELRVLCAGLRDFAPGPIGALGELRHLDLSWSDGLADLEFVRRLTRLRVLKLQGTDITDLAPLDKLQSLAELAIRRTLVESLGPLSDLPDLRRVDASFSELTALPDGELPGLELIQAVGTLLADEEVARFRKLNPHCRLHSRWMEPFRERVAEATRLRVCTVATYSANRVETLFETKDPRTIRSLSNGLEVREWRPERNVGYGRCTCLGQLMLEFWQEDRLLAAVSVHHETSLRWCGWQYDARLTDRGAGFLRQWFVRRGIVEK